MRQFIGDATLELNDQEPPQKERGHAFRCIKLIGVCLPSFLKKELQIYSWSVPGFSEVLPLDNLRLLGGLAVFADNGGAALLAERGIGQDDLETVAGSQMVSPGLGRTTSTMALISGRGVKYCPAPDLVSWAFFSSKPS